MAAEKQFENRVKTYLSTHGAYLIKYWGGGDFTKSGVPDLLVCFRGYFMGIELKAPRGKPSELQKYNLDQISAAGGFGILLYPKNYDEFKNLIEAIETNDISKRFERFPNILKKRWR